MTRARELNDMNSDPTEIMSAPGSGHPRHPPASSDIAAAEALRLLGTVSFGRIAFARHALPTIRPANHILDEGRVIVAATALLSSHRQAVAYEVDTLDAATQRGWCVIVTGPAEEVTDPQLLLRYRALLEPWLPGHRIIAIDPDIVTGIRFRPGTRTPAPFTHRMA
ncbi:pyridoxamine 5'-phosphate oxidase family protein [Nocardia sp. NPDC050712]|uniref:pyridoxamine 5'-phosphate oxidase family protein n=1 Tax=Nocardia sp. NPDC050712 TaxID=3155518 RepID=UPI0033DA50F5